MQRENFTLHDIFPCLIRSSCLKFPANAYIQCPVGSIPDEAKALSLLAPANAVAGILPGGGLLPTPNPMSNSAVRLPTRPLAPNVRRGGCLSSPAGKMTVVCVLRRKSCSRPFERDFCSAVCMYWLLAQTGMWGHQLTFHRINRIPSKLI